MRNGWWRRCCQPSAGPGAIRRRPLRLPRWTTPRALRAALLGYADRLIAAEADVAVAQARAGGAEAKAAELAPDAAAARRLAEVAGSMNITDAAKHLGVKPGAPAAREHFPMRQHGFSS